MLSKAAVLMLPHNFVDVDSIKTAALDSDNVNLQPPASGHITSHST